MDERPIQNCHFEFDCPADFGSLKETDDPTVRFCEKCNKSVFRCNSMAEFNQHQTEGHCVWLALNTSNSLSKGDNVRITSGAYRNTHGIIVDVNEEDQTAKVNLILLGTPGSLDVDLSQLERDENWGWNKDV